MRLNLNRLAYMLHIYIGPFKEYFILFGLSEGNSKLSSESSRTSAWGRDFQVVDDGINGAFGWEAKEVFEIGQFGSNAESCTWLLTPDLIFLDLSDFLFFFFKKIIMANWSK